MNRHIRDLSFVVLAASACWQQSQLPVGDLPPSDAAVYRAVLDSLFIQPGKNRITQLVIKDSTTVWRRENLIGGVIEGFFKLPGVDTSAVRDFEARNRDAVPLKELSLLGLKTPVTLVADQALSSLPRQDPDRYWNQFYQRYPGSSGQIALSAVGYGATGNIAILMVSNGCGTLCGSGDMVVLKRTGQVWRIAAIQNLWVS